MRIDADVEMLATIYTSEYYGNEEKKMMKREITSHLKVLSKIGERECHRIPFLQYHFSRLSSVQGKG